MPSPVSHFEKAPFGQSSRLDFPAVLDAPATPSEIGRRQIGSSREGRPVWGFSLGRGAHAISLIGGCHADEPVGPAMLDRLVSWLQSLDRDHPLIASFTWRLIPHTNPDGEARNLPWTRELGPASRWTSKAPQVEVDLGTYLEKVVREKPGDDLEFGFPYPAELAGSVGGARDDAGAKAPDTTSPARPEALAIAAFLSESAPFRLHASFHGMAFAAGPWFLTEKSWSGRTAEMRDGLRRLVANCGYVVHDIDRRGEKGFERIDRGFTTRPDSRAMSAHFIAAGDPEMASRFRPSSMEFVRSLGGDAFTFVSEMPLFILPLTSFPRERPVHVPATAILRLAAAKGPEALAKAVAETGVRPMPLRDQIFFQLAFLEGALESVMKTLPGPLV